MELFKKSASELSELIHTGQCSAREVTDAFLARIGAVEPKVEAFITVTPERAHAQADAVDKKIAAGEPLAPLAGVPVAVKDNFMTSGVLSTCASKMLHNFVPMYSSHATDLLDAAGAVMLGKTNLDEFAMGSSTETSYYKKTKNPHDLTCAPGGSSGGSAAALAAGMAPLALGSDTGGSIRQPSSFCGLVGLKPTYGAVSRYGVAALASSLDQVGPMARTVKDTAMLFSAIAGLDKRDAQSAYFEHPDYVAALTGDVKGLRIGIPREFFEKGIQPDVADSVMCAARELEAAGAQLVQVSVPGIVHATAVYYVICTCEGSSNLSKFDAVNFGYRTENYSGLREMYSRSRAEAFGDEVKRRILFGTAALCTENYNDYFVKAQKVLLKIRADFAAAFEKCDMLLTPTSPTAAFKLGKRSEDPTEMYAADVCTTGVNLAGLPAISVPCGADSSGMPYGMQLIGNHFTDAAVLNAAYAYEQIFGGFNKVASL